MPEEARLWKIEVNHSLHESPRDLETRLEGWLERDISCLDPSLLVIGLQVEQFLEGLAKSPMVRAASPGG